MKSFYITGWVALSGLVGQLGIILGQASINLTSLVDWSLTGWAFMGSTTFVVYEILQKKSRSGFHRVLLIFVGMSISLGLSKPLIVPITKKVDWVTPEFVIYVVALFGYLILQTATSKRAIAIIIRKFADFIDSGKQ